jgi:RNA polymerase sigma-70 factor (ECF subfamily)
MAQNTGFRQGKVSIGMLRPRQPAPGQYDAARLEPALRRYFRRRAAANEVDDLVQEVFIHLQSRRSAEPVEDIDRYVFVVAGNVLMRRHRRERRWTRALDIDATYDDELISPERALLGKDQLQSAVGVLAQLPPRTREIFMLHRFEEMTYSRIASALGVSQSAVEKHMIRALRALHGLEKAQ